MWVEISADIPNRSKMSLHGRKSTWAQICADVPYDGRRFALVEIGASATVLQLDFKRDIKKEERLFSESLLLSCMFFSLREERAYFSRSSRALRNSPFWGASSLLGFSSL